MSTTESSEPVTKKCMPVVGDLNSHLPSRGSQTFYVAGLTADNQVFVYIHSLFVQVHHNVSINTILNPSNALGYT